jgi:hypothetical protein
MPIFIVSMMAPDETRVSSAARMPAMNVGKWAGRQGGEFHLPKAHRPFLTGVAGGFSCANCAALDQSGGKNRCRSPDYKKLMGTDRLVDPGTGEALSDDDLKGACSDWFTPRKWV